jgi:serine/threonine protein kinase
MVFGLESWRGAPALVMEYLEGGTLADRLRRSPMAPADVVGMARDLAGAIALIHDGGLLHRDIKPSNIAFTRTGQPKLLDFGLAQIFVAGQPRESRPRAVGDPATWLAGADNTTVDHFGRFAGTPAYMAPEALGGEFLDGAADLWSFGVVLYECLTGERPAAAAVPVGAGGKGWAREIAARVPGCPPALGEVIGDLLAPDKRQRPPSAHALRNRLFDHATLRVA